MDQSQLHAYETRCVQDEPPGCQTMCPVHLDARAFAACMEEGKFQEARRILDRALPLSGLLARLCHGPCRPHCRRAEVDEALNLPLLERACAANTRAIRPMALPATGKRLGVLGSGLSSLAAAYELARKGHEVTLLHAPDGPGAGLLLLPETLLPAAAVAEALELLSALRVCPAPLPKAGPASWQNLLDEFQALYLGQDDPALDPQAFGLGAGDLRLDPITGATQIPGVFAGGFPAGGNRSFMHAAAAGKLAAGSVTRALQGVAPGSARDKDATYPSLLYVNLDQVLPLPPIRPENELQPS
ncbi:MAG: NAD(P)-binding protein, partial [Deltaproteobacteria bacterium]|nr:NAD(P)-binding protein [Deltaproteobacteria bacterium]